MSAFRKCGSAYRLPLKDGTALWLRRTSGRWALLWHHFDNSGERQWLRLGTFSSLAAAKTDAYAIRNDEEVTA